MECIDMALDVGQVANSCRQGSEIPSFTKCGEFFEFVKTWQLFTEGCAPRI
jgi:hypothetical protein